MSWALCASVPWCDPFGVGTERRDEHSSLLPATDCSSGRSLAAHAPRVDEEVVDLPGAARGERRELHAEVRGRDRQSERRRDVARRLPVREVAGILLGDVEDAERVAEEPVEDDLDA